MFETIVIVLLAILISWFLFSKLPKPVKTEGVLKECNTHFYYTLIGFKDSIKLVSPKKYSGSILITNTSILIRRKSFFNSIARHMWADFDIFQNDITFGLNIIYKGEPKKYVKKTMSLHIEFADFVFESIVKEGDYTVIYANSVELGRVRVVLFDDVVVSCIKEVVL